MVDKKFLMQLLFDHLRSNLQGELPNTCITNLFIQNLHTKDAECMETMFLQLAEKTGLASNPSKIISTSLGAMKLLQDNDKPSLVYTPHYAQNVPHKIVLKVTNFGSCIFLHCKENLIKTAWGGGGRGDLCLLPSLGRFSFKKTQPG